MHIVTFRALTIENVLRKIVPNVKSLQCFTAINTKLMFSIVLNPRLVTDIACMAGKHKFTIYFYYEGERIIVFRRSSSLFPYFIKIEKRH